MIERLQQQLPCIHAQRFGRGKINFTHSEKSKTARLAQMHVLEISAKVYNYYTHQLMGGFRRDSRYYSCSSCANCVLCNSRLYYSAAGTSNCRDNNIDYCCGRGSMAVCKIPFMLAGNFPLL